MLPLLGALVLGSAGEACVRNSCVDSVVTVPADCQSIAAAVACIPDGKYNRTEIRIQPGLYSEKVVVPESKGPISLVGLGQAPKWPPLNPSGASAVTISYAEPSNCNDSTSTGCGTLVVHANDFLLANVTVRNNLTNFEQPGKNFALYLTGDRMAVYRSAFQGKDDVVYTGTNRVYFFGCVTNGSADFNFGEGAGVWDNCDIVAEPGQFWSFLTAQSRPLNSSRRYLIQNSRVPMAPGSRIGTTFLGRPWGPGASVIFKNCWLDKHIASPGWALFRGQKCSNTATTCMNVTFAEFNSTGPGANPAARVSWSKQLSASDAATYTPNSVLEGWTPPLEPL